MEIVIIAIVRQPIALSDYNLPKTTLLGVVIQLSKKPQHDDDWHAFEQSEFHDTCTSFAKRFIWPADLAALSEVNISLNMLPQLRAFRFFYGVHEIFWNSSCYTFLKRSTCLKLDATLTPIENTSLEETSNSRTDTANKHPVFKHFIAALDQSILLNFPKFLDDCSNGHRPLVIIPFEREVFKFYAWGIEYNIHVIAEPSIHILLLRFVENLVSNLWNLTIMNEIVTQSSSKSFCIVSCPFYNPVETSGHSWWLVFCSRNVSCQRHNIWNLALYDIIVFV